MTIPSTLAKTRKMRPGRPKAHQNEFWDTFLIKLLIRNTISSTHAKPESEAWTAQGSPNLVLGHFLNSFHFHLAPLQGNGP